LALPWHPDLWRICLWPIQFADFSRATIADKDMLNQQKFFDQDPETTHEEIFNLALVIFRLLASGLN
jgi:hypothetical protein